MKYITCERPGQFLMKETTPPEIITGNILLKVKRVGICGTDLHAFKGNQPFFSYPRILGHELAAEVLGIDRHVDKVSLGDRMVIVPYVNCQECVACKAGKTNCCQRLAVMGVHSDGGMQDVISVPDRLLIPANDLSLDESAIVEPLAIGAHALRRAQTKKNEIIVVLGCGPIGMGIVQLAKYTGAKVIAVDLNDNRLKLAKEAFGADWVVNGLHAPIEQVKELTGGEMANTVFDATGNKRAMESGPEYARHGGSFVLVGLFKGELSFYHPALHAKELTIMSSRNATKEDFEFVMMVLREKKFNTKAYITKRVSYKSILTDFESWTAPESDDIKIVTHWNE